MGGEPTQLKWSEHRELAAKPVLNEDLKRLQQLRKEFSETAVRIFQTEQVLDKNFIYAKEKLGFILGAAYAAAKDPLASQVLPWAVPKKGMDSSDLRQANIVLSSHAADVLKLKALTAEANELLARINNNDNMAARASVDYPVVSGYLFYAGSLLQDFKTGYKPDLGQVPKNEQITIRAGHGTGRRLSDSEVEEQLKKADLVPLPPSYQNTVLLYQTKDVYLDKKTGAVGTMQQIDLIRDIRSGKKEINIDEFIYLIPLLGSGFGIANCLWTLHEGPEAKKGEAKFMLALHIVGLGLDSILMVQMWRGTVVRMAGREALLGQAEKTARGMVKESAAITITDKEKEIFIKAASSSSAKDMEKLIKIAGRKNSWNAVADGLEALAKSRYNGEINEAAIKQYIKNEFRVGPRAKGVFSGVAHDFSGLYEEGFMRYKNEFLMKEIARGTNFKVIEALGRTFPKDMTLAQRKKATDAVLASVLTFSPKAQSALLKKVQQEGWAPIIRAIDTELKRLGPRAEVGEATMAAMAKLFKEYSHGYAAAPMKEWITYGIYIGSVPLVIEAVKNIMSFAWGAGMGYAESKINGYNKEIEDYQRVSAAFEPLDEKQQLELKDLFSTIDRLKNK
ncbi:MAG: hypothetical protein V1492_04070 [Candidatus Micrarchaeota archaeon]